jgi:hypothetical protein
MNAVEPQAPGPLTPAKLRIGRIVFWGFAAAAAYFLWTEHRAHTVQILPWLLVAACPLMHLFMHRGHGHRHDGGSRDERGGS